ncbi:MAG: methyltransferase domain-containing protein, partial [Candidatus Roizmanbacteria bacterium]|nr:methyltransferase domain-containing protein [Candidatus Roizmanbacteria bacterium]
QQCKAHVLEFNVIHSQLVRGQKHARGQRVASFPHFIQGDYHNLPFAPESVDVFWSLESIEHAYNVSEFLDEAFRVLKSGGRAIIAGTFKGDVEPTQKQTDQLIVGARAAGVFYDFRTAQEIAWIMSNSGFSNVREQDVTHHVMPSSREMKRMCQWGLPGATIGNALGIIPDVMVDNTAWGTYQEDLFADGITSYHILTAKKM